MAGWDDLWEWLYQELQENAAIEEAADTGYNTAMDMCGNEGQVSVIDMTGYDAFHEAAEEIAQGSGQGFDVLMAACPYPEAVTFILQEATSVMIEIINEAVGDLLDDVDAAGGDEGEDEDEGGLLDF